MKPVSSIFFITMILGLGLIMMTNKTTAQQNCTDETVMNTKGGWKKRADALMNAGNQGQAISHIDAISKLFQTAYPEPKGMEAGGVSGEDMAGLSMNFGSALPWNIKFLAKDGEQIIVNSRDEQGSLKIVVRKIKDD